MHNADSATITFYCFLRNIKNHRILMHCHSLLRFEMWYDVYRNIFHLFTAPAAYTEQVYVCTRCHLFLTNRWTTKPTEFVEWPIKFTGSANWKISVYKTLRKTWNFADFITIPIKRPTKFIEPTEWLHRIHFHHQETDRRYQMSWVTNQMKITCFVKQSIANEG